ncbi:PstS family phosphate ABC transporter substrate-binding protein [Phormidium tenue]|uniref:Phosphate-binding protein n=1 Tax=Phormidium tenue NIES-30 TaxID=549789 RepID=A0A1U7J594_9CYAN|nr:PstS family phosphate ABC transporter substrate-binding protein [Phormidium tenue]MBD2232690.1 PstS family phosphate ABC transporter substrate-binding protein [Phormidium tenue FACHB-1052]OKH47813.1 phosphate-binding protein [Phormidium tenue NIES-30]
MVLSKKVLRVGYSSALVAMMASLAACGGGSQTATPDAGTTETAAGSELSGTVLVDGSSTVFPISEAMAEEFGTANPGVAVTVGVSGTGGGFKKFCAGETDITGASRPISQEEIDLCAQAGIEYIELPIALDGLTVVVNPENDFAECLTTDELLTIWEPEAQDNITNWNQVRADFPDAPLGLYGAGTDSGTYDFFMEAIGADGESRGDYTASEDDNVIVQGVSSDTNGLGFFGLAYFIENQDKLKAVAIDSGNGTCVEPSAETVADGTYVPLSRPEFIYVKLDKADDPAVAAFVNFYISPDNAGLVDEVGYVSVPSEINTKVISRFENKTTGTVFEGGSPIGVKLDEVL